MLCSDTFFLYYYFGQLLDSNQLVVISPFHVKIYENCEMFETNYWNPLEGKWSVAPSPSKTYISAFGLPTFSATESLLEDFLACWEYGRKVIFRVHVIFSISEMILSECFWELRQYFCLSKQYLSLLLSQYLYCHRWVIWDNFLRRELVIHKLQCITEERSKALTV